jgi:hypothetical protein
MYYTLLGTLFNDSESTSTGDLMLPDPNVFSSSVFLYLCYRYRLAMDESKSEVNVRCCSECTVVHYIFRLLYGDRGRYGSRHHSFM